VHIFPIFFTPHTRLTGQRTSWGQHERCPSSVPMGLGCGGHGGEQRWNLIGRGFVNIEAIEQATFVELLGWLWLIMVDFVLSRFYPIKWVNSPRFWCSLLHLRLHFGLWLPKKSAFFWLRPFKCKLMMKLSCVFSVFFRIFPSSNTTSNRANYPFFMPGVVRFPSRNLLKILASFCKIWNLAKNCAHKHSQKKQQLPGSSKGCWMDDKGCLYTIPQSSNSTLWKMLVYSTDID